MTKPTGYVLWRGLSPINRHPIVSIITLSSSNRKTGNMAQVWILHEDVNPVQAVLSGYDESVCGDCIHRKNYETGKRSCYVNVGQAPLAVWRAYKANKYPHINSLSKESANQLMSSLAVRFGAYGDPCTIDPSIVHWITSTAKSYTGYTHQWDKPWAQWSARVFMASVDSLAEHELAKAIGYKTFSVLRYDAKSCEHAKQCPATVEHSTAQCVTCGLCDGSKSDIWVSAHGSGKRIVSYG